MAKTLEVIGNKVGPLNKDELTSDMEIKHKDTKIGASLRISLQDAHTIISYNK